MNNNFDAGKPKMELSVALMKGATLVRTLFSDSSSGAGAWKTVSMPITGLLPRGYELHVVARQLVPTIAVNAVPRIALATTSLTQCTKSYTSPDCTFENGTCTYLNALDLKPTPSTVHNSLCTKFQT